jgi:carotenoid 1,2-hydratase
VRGRGASGSGGADGDALRPASGRGDLERPNFNIPVGPNGYAWWYIDGLSDCGTKAISIIAFIGSVFSPWYRWSGRKHPQNHVCINVATYGKGGRFTMTDRGHTALRQTATRFEVGPSMLRWEDGALVIDIDEVSSPPLISRVRGQVIVRPEALTSVELPLTPDGAHVWRPFAPRSRIDVQIDRPGWSWSGEGYFDANFGTRALEEDFSYWTWGRFPTADGATCFYDAERLDGSALAAAFRFGPDGSAEEIDLPPKVPFRRSLWAVKRETRADAGFQPHQVQNMLDAPFYSRSAVKTRLNGEETVGVHEALDLRRFRSPLLKPMLAVRVPRRAGWDFTRSSAGMRPLPD